jgi:hypothetical protein
MASLLKAYPTEKLAQLYFYPEYPDSSICENYYRITDMDIVDALRDRKKQIGDTVHLSDSQKDNSISGIYRKARFTNLSITRLLRDAIWHGRWNSLRLRDWLDDFHPQAILFLGIGNAAHYQIALFVKDRYDASIIAGTTDDVFLFRFSFDPAYYIRTAWLRRSMRKILATDDTAFVVINEYAKTAYKKLFHKDSVVLMNVPAVSGVCPQYSAHDGRIRIAYIGNFGNDRGSILRKLGNFLMRSKYRDFYTIEIYTKDQLDEKMMGDINKPPYIVFGGALNAKEVVQKQAEVDGLLHVDSFKYQVRKYTRLSLSTKITEYMAAGRPVLAIGPAEISSIKFLAGHGNPCIAELTQEMFDSKLGELMSLEYRQEAGENNYLTVQRIVQDNDMGDRVENIALSLMEMKSRTPQNKEI